jgi:hypothetical protein
MSGYSLNYYEYFQILAGTHKPFRRHQVHGHVVGDPWFRLTIGMQAVYRSDTAVALKPERLAVWILESKTTNRPSCQVFKVAENKTNICCWLALY